jgi:acyl dehydratase
VTLLTDEVRAWIGRTVAYTAPEPLGRAAIRYYAVAVGDRNPLYFDDELARAHGYDGVVAPPTLIFDTTQYVDADPDEHGYPGHAWGLDVSGATMLRGGNAYELHQPVRPDDVITATWTLTDIVERGGRRPMLVVTSEARYTNQHGELLATNRETLLYLGAAS